MPISHLSQKKNIKVYRKCFFLRQVPVDATEGYLHIPFTNTKNHRNQREKNNNKKYKNTKTIHCTSLISSKMLPFDKMIVRFS